MRFYQTGSLIFRLLALWKVFKAVLKNAVQLKDVMECVTVDKEMAEHILSLGHLCCRKGMKVKL